ncbi:hypothetical protein LOTGIDRAFT_160604 [Lottia gigantea]|uniref:Uncharacterized protein n=1 Tax=Lottia gigantea TaxID=225164 RepID=V4C1W2_LOTGI|nr:hypothetical protein LOTGIDRAFT_160604 [Lottia gigantea]ESO95454.1 hypothetical protein LOTGIDRAFT_160604 [Lottia gigantea]
MAGIVTMLSLLVFLTTGNCEYSDPVPLYVGTMFPKSNHWFRNYGNFLTLLFEYAFEEINNRTDILDGYSLKVIPKDSQGIPGLAAKKFMELIDEPPTKIAMIGPALSDELLVVGQIPQYYNLLEFLPFSREVKTNEVMIQAISAGKNINYNLEVTESYHPR